MWSHYGDRHRGICLGFDVDDSIKIVKYSSRRLSLLRPNSASTIDPPEEVKDLLLTTKFDRWSYEDERRLIEPLTQLEEEGSYYFKKFDDTLKLVRVIAGPSSAR